MKFFAAIRTRRHTAFVVSLVWLFALASSVANACLLEAREPHSAAAQNSLAASSHEPAELRAQRGADAGHHGDSGATKESCLKACDDGANTLPATNPGVDCSDPGPARLVATLWSVSPHVASAPQRVDDLTIPIFGPPLRVRFSRLAL